MMPRRSMSFQEFMSSREAHYPLLDMHRNAVPEFPHNDPDFCDACFLRLKTRGDRAGYIGKARMPQDPHYGLSNDGVTTLWMRLGGLWRCPRCGFTAPGRFPTEVQMHLQRQECEELSNLT